MVARNGIHSSVSSEPAESEDRMQPRITSSILAAIGRTPLIRLRNLAQDVPAQVLVKLEALNPGGSIKDRVGVAMVDEAERQGWLRPGGTIIEATAGNTGVGLALAAAVKGYRCIFVLPDKMSGEKIRLLKAYGAEIVITPTSVPPDSPESYNGVADRLAREIPGAWRPNQFTNLANPEVHYRTTGPEIWDQTGGRITALVAGVGTGGTISGVGRFFKEQESRNQGHRRRSRGLRSLRRFAETLEGRGHRRRLRAQDLQRPGRRRLGSRRRRRELPHRARAGTARRPAGGRLVGNGRRGRTRATPADSPAEDVVVALCPDTGRNYMSKMFRRRLAGRKQVPWHRAGGADRRRPAPARAARGRYGQSAPTRRPPKRSSGCSRAASRSFRCSSDGRAVGSIQEVTLARLLHDGLDPQVVRVGDVMARPLPQVDVRVHLDEAYRLLLSGNSGVLATEEGAVVDIITRIDLISYWNRARATLISSQLRDRDV